MKKRYITENFFKTKLSQQCLPIDSAWDPLTEFTISLETTPTNSEWWIILDFNDSLKRDLIYYHNKSLTTITYYRKNRSNPTVRHNKNSFAQINDVAQLFNYLFDNIDDLGVVNNMWTNKIKILWGKCYYNKAFKTVSDSGAITLADWTHYAVLDYTDDTLKAVTVLDTDSQLKFGTIIVTAWAITSIEDNRTNQLQSNKNVLDGLSDSWWNLTYNWVPLWWGAGTWDVIWPSSAIDEELIVANWSTGKVIKGSWKKIETTLTNSPDKIPTSEAIVAGTFWYNTITSKSDNTIYQAGAKGGLLVAVVSSWSYCVMTAYSDANATPTTVVWYEASEDPWQWSNAWWTITVPILPNHYYKVVWWTTINFYEHVL